MNTLNPTATTDEITHQTTLTATIPADLVAELRQAAEEEGKSVDSLVRSMVEIYLEGRS